MITLRMPFIALFAALLALPAHAMEEGSKRKAENSLESQQNKEAKTEETVTIETQNSVITIEKWAAKLSPTVKNAIEDLAENNETSTMIPLTYCDADALSIIFKVLKAVDRYKKDQYGIVGETTETLLATSYPADIQRLLRAFNTAEFRAFFADNQSIDAAIQYLDLPLLRALRSEHAYLHNYLTNYASPEQKEALYETLINGQAADNIPELEPYLRYDYEEQWKPLFALLDKPLDQNTNAGIYHRFNTIKEHLLHFSMYWVALWNRPGYINIQVESGNFVLFNREGAAEAIISIPTNYTDLNEGNIARSNINPARIAFIHQDKLVIMSLPECTVIKEFNATLFGFAAQDVSNFYITPNAWSPNGTWLMVKSHESMYLINIETDEIIKFPSVSPYCCRWSSNNRYLLMAEFDTCYIFDTKTRITRTLDANSYVLVNEDGECPANWALSNDSKYIALVEKISNKVLYLWNLEEWFTIADYLQNNIELSPMRELLSQINNPQQCLQTLKSQLNDQ